jgi:hypothetical protein
MNEFLHPTHGKRDRSLDGATNNSAIAALGRRKDLWNVM